MPNSTSRLTRIYHEQADTVIVHPLVLLSVVDHYNRVAKDTRKRVVGVLLGEIYKGQLDVTNSFAGEVSETLTYCNVDILKNLCDMHRCGDLYVGQI
jgi:hypothetical protein